MGIFNDEATKMAQETAEREGAEAQRAAVNGVLARGISVDLIEHLNGRADITVSVADNRVIARFGRAELTITCKGVGDGATFEVRGDHGSGDPQTQSQMARRAMAWIRNAG